ncbi:hypothetical protein CI238_07701 [Colletotrichum incanum]|uniref:Uncharacterized protein n=1 Tax=Colletotrichum incanum TaxID=1573173 RepID=A0A167DCV9_COLIC|nr:hypothetical protein CI238_07701 [Colletotrichum incanum]
MAYLFLPQHRSAQHGRIMYWELFIIHSASYHGHSLQHIRALGITTMIPGVRQKSDYPSHVTPLHDIFLLLLGLGLCLHLGHLAIIPLSLGLLGGYRVAEQGWLSRGQCLIVLLSRRLWWKDWLLELLFKADGFSAKRLAISPPRKASCHKFGQQLIDCHGRAVAQ